MIGVRIRTVVALLSHLLPVGQRVARSLLLCVHARHRGRVGRRNSGRARPSADASDARCKGRAELVGDAKLPEWLVREMPRITSLPTTLNVGRPSQPKQGCGHRVRVE